MNRRNFLKIGGIASLGLSLGASCTLLGESQYNWPTNWMWLHANLEKSDKEWREILSKISKAGINGILIGGGVPMLERIIPLAKEVNIDVHAWMWTLNRAGDKEALKHPDWYAVSRKGDSCFDVRPYVDYYQWLCPSKEEVFQHIKKQVDELLTVTGLKGVHLDYVRYSDVILAEALQPVYNLVQDKEYPEFDFCYCDDCRDTFLKESGIDIKTLDDPTQSLEWRQYRYDSVTRLVNRLSDVVHTTDKKITAAVFPYPEIARTICRQSWNDWNIDAAFPMIYHNFYNKGMDWIGESTKKGVNDVKAKFPIFSGLYIPYLEEGQLSVAIENSMSNGAKGFAVFGYKACKDFHFDELTLNQKKL